MGVNVNGANVSKKHLENRFFFLTTLIQVDETAGLT